MQLQTPKNRRRGRPPRRPDSAIDTRDLLIRTGLETLTEQGYSATGLDKILKRAGVPKGSFYHYFESKEAFGLQIIDSYGDFFAKKLDHHFSNPALPPLDRLRAFVNDAKSGMARFNYRRGCLIGNLGQEMGSLPESFRQSLIKVFEDWRSRLTTCFSDAQETGDLSHEFEPAQLAASFWIGWEGAVLHAKLEQSAAPLDIFANIFFTSIQSK